MDDPTLYHQVNKMQTQDAEDFLEEYLNMVKFAADGGDEIIDVGCGTGNVTYEILRPLLPRGYKKIVATDISEKMIKTASQKYQDSKLQFELLDISKDIPEQMVDKFDHAFSFYCLHWIQDQRKAVQNIYDLVRPGGDVLLVLIAKCAQVHESLKQMATKPRWQKYMTDVRNYLLPYQDDNNPAGTLRCLMEGVGFHVELCQLRERQHVFSDLNSLTRFMASINPFVKRMPDNEKTDFMSEYVGLMQDRDEYPISDTMPTKYYSSLVVYARKPMSSS